MKKIPLRCKKHPKLFAMVDDEDFERVNRFKWYVLDSNKNGKLFYAIKRPGRDQIRLLHRFILRMRKTSKTVDHINGNGLDCRKVNMRLATRTENARYRRFRINKTGAMGVYKVRSKYQASVRVDGKNTSLGYFKTIKEASDVRERFTKNLYGEFYRPK